MTSSILTANTYTDNQSGIDSRVSVGTLSIRPQPSGVVMIPTFDASDLWPDLCWIFPTRLTTGDVPETDSDYAARIRGEVLAAQADLAAGTINAVVLNDITTEIPLCNKYGMPW